MISLAVLRSRLADAQDERDVARRSLRRAKSALATSRSVCARALEERDDARRCAATLQATLYRLAAHQLGMTPDRLRDRRAGSEVCALVDRWLAEGQRRSTREAKAFEDELAAQLSRVMGRLFGGEEDRDG